MENDFTKNYYSHLATVHGNDPRMSMRDLYIREKENEFFVKSLQSRLQSEQTKIKILDLGCGNGYLLKVLSETFSDDQIELFGLEYSPELFNICQQENINASFDHGDARNKESYEEEEFDLILSQRALINILNLKEQKQTLQNIFYWLKPNGLYVCSESFREPLHNLSMASQEMSFPELKPSKHNLYFWRQNFESSMNDFGFQKEEPSMPENSLSTHFYMTRVIHRLIRPRRGKKNPKFFKQFFHQALEPTIGDFSPILFYKWKKKLLN